VGGVSGEWGQRARGGSGDTAQPGQGQKGGSRAGEFPLYTAHALTTQSLAESQVINTQHSLMHENQS
jgi:hypothetical protein